MTLVRGADVDMESIETAKVDFSPDRLTAYFKNLGFETLIARLNGAENKIVEHTAPVGEKKQAQGEMF